MITKNLYQTVPVGQTWIFKIENGKQYTARSTSKYFLYQLTDKNLIITARKEVPEYIESNVRPQIIISDKYDNDVASYTLYKNYAPKPEAVTIYYGSSAEVPDTLTPEGYKTVQVSGNSGSVTFTNTDRTKWIALPNGWTLTEWKEISDNTSLISNLSTKTVDNYTMYYEYNNFVDTNTMKAVFDKQ